MSFLSEFQSAIYKALMAEPSLREIVGTRIFDDVPHEAETISTVFPRVTIGDQSAEVAGSDTHDAMVIAVELHAWSRMAGRKECLDIVTAIIDALHDKQHGVGEGVLVHLFYEGHETDKEGDGETYHAAVRFSGLYQFG